jgi:drug/metabolite transporter (DMT)-like permease
VTFWSVGNVMVARLDLPGLQIAFWRLLLGAVLYGLVLYAGGRRISLHTVRLVAPAGVVLGLEIGVFFVALHSTTVANATTIGALQPIVLLVVASRRFREPVGRWLVGGAVVAIGGVTLVMFGAGAGMGLNLRGDLLALVSMFLFSAYFALVKDVRHRVDTFTLQTTSMAVGALVLLPVAAVDAGTIGLPFPSGTQWAWLAALLAVPGTGHLLMNWSHLHVPLSLTGLMTLGIPVISAAGAWAALDQAVTATQGVGMAIVIGVLVLVVRRDARSTAATGAS